MFVPVVDKNNNPLMPTIPSRARKWIATRKATPFWKKGVFCVRLNVEPSDNKRQDIVVGIDPGSKKEGFTVKSASHTYLNIQADAVTWVKDAITLRRQLRRGRRYRKTPYRQCRMNRVKESFLAPSTKARWQWKLRILNWLNKLFPVTCVIVEDIKTRTLEKPNWDKSFSPLENGKNWFYQQIFVLIPNLITKEGWETKALRDSVGLHKTKNKLSNSFDAHCVDSWVLANSIVGGHNLPDNEDILYLQPLRFHRRQLHALCPSKGNIRRNYGGTMSLGLKRGSLVKHDKYGLCYVGGTSKSRISLHNMFGKRLCQNAKVEDCKFLCYSSWSFN